MWWYIPSMECKILFTDECENWLLSLNDKEQVDVLAVIKLLEKLGHRLGYPYSSKIIDAKLSHLRELRIQHKGKPYRILYAFDPKRAGILLIGGNKGGDDRWYKKHIPIAEKLYDRHLKTLEKQTL